MTWLNNPLMTMPGPAFLALYLSLFALGGLRVKLTRWRADTTRALPHVRLPDTPDPSMIAHLRGQERAVIRAALIQLTERGYLSSDCGGGGGCGGCGG